MTEVEADQLREAVQNMHGGTATLAQSVPVRETFQGQTVWEGVVHVFDLAGHPTATRAYAWSSPIEKTPGVVNPRTGRVRRPVVWPVAPKRRFFAVLHTDRINSPIEAVRAAIVAEHRAERPRNA
jgi:hypothetical protein